MQEQQQQQRQQQHRLTGSILRIPPPVIDVNFCRSGDDKFKLTGVKDGDEARVNYFVEPAQQALHLGWERDKEKYLDKETPYFVESAEQTLHLVQE